MHYLMGFTRQLLLVFGLMVCSLPGHSLDLGLSSWSKEKKLLAVNAGTMAFITVWGITKWDYFDRSPNAQSEGWFGYDTKEGGADKLGHLWSAYAFADGLNSLYRGWGYDADTAARNGALSSFAIMGFMEVGDSFSNYGFSWEDMLMNTMGSASSYLLYHYPALDEKLDLRWEYAPDFSNADIFTDYENTRYLAALQLDGFDQFRETPLRYVELQVGYYARGFETARPDRERNFYVGVGLNVGRVLTDLGCGRFCKVFHYYQPPYTSLRSQ